MMDFKFNALITSLILIFLSGCTLLNPVLDVVESGSKSYEVVKNANSLGKVADGLGTLADTRKIKVQTTDSFVKGVGVLISKQPLDIQADLISQSIQAKVSIEENTRYKGTLEGAAISWAFIILIVIIRFVMLWYKPTPKKKKTESSF